MYLSPPETSLQFVMPAEASIQALCISWILAFAEMTTLLSNCRKTPGRMRESLSEAAGY